MKNAATKGKPGADSGVLAQAIYRYLPYWPLFLLMLALAVSGSSLYLRYTPKLYESSAKLLVKDEKKGTEDAKALGELNAVSTKKIVENELEVIQSRTLLDEVVKNLNLYSALFVKGKVRDEAAYLTSPVKVIAQDPDKLKDSKQIFFTYDSVTGTVRMGKNRFAVGEWVKTSFGTIRFEKNELLTDASTGSLYFTLNHPKSVVNDLQKRLKITTPSKQSSIVDLSITDEVPQRGEDILNEIMKDYREDMISDKNQLAANTMAFVEERLKSVDRDLEAIEKKNQQFRAGRDAVNVSEQGKLYLQNVSSNDQKIGDINMQLAVLDQVQGFAATKEKGGEIIPATIGVKDAVLGQLINKLSSLELEYKSLKNTNAENSAAMLSLASQIDELRPNILANVKSQRRGLQLSRDNLATTNNGYATALQAIPEKEKQLIEINREQAIKNNLHDFLLQKKEETALSQASTVSDTRIIDKAGSTEKPISPKPKLIYVAAGLLALIAVIAFIAARETFNNKIMFRHEIEGYTIQPIIGEITSEKSKQAIVTGDDRKTFIAQQFRRLRMSLRYIDIDSKRKKVLITSAIGGEGKSFIAANLALSLAMTEKRVVLVDCDLHNASLHKKLDAHNNVGVSDYLSGMADVEELIQGTSLDENLFFVPAGTLMRNPSELLMNGKIQHLLTALEGLFDYVIVDTAPVSPVTDAYVLAPICDATLFVIRHKYTPKVFVQRIDAENRINTLHNMAIVFNGISARGFASENYGYGYGYGYVHDDGSSDRLRVEN